MSCLPNLAELYHEPNQTSNFHKNNKKPLINQNWELKNSSKQKKHELNTISDSMSQSVPLSLGKH